MPDKADLIAVVLATVGFLATVVYVTTVPNSFNGNVPSFEVILLDTVPIYFYAGYWAFSIRHALAVPLYRRQALGIGFTILAIWGSLAEFAGLPKSLSLRIYVPITTFTFYILFFVIFYWIDASILASRKSDPLLRDPLYWSKVRIPLWIANSIIWGIPLVMISAAAFLGNTTLLEQMNMGTFPDSVAGNFMTIIYNFAPLLAPIVGVVYLPAIAIRSKWDRALRRHFVWFSVVALFLVVFFLNPPDTPEGHLIPGLIIVITGFALYKSVRALVPLNRISSHESVLEGKQP